MSQLNQKILLVEDTLSLATVYQNWLKKAGFECDHVDTGKAAIEILNKCGHRVLLLDLQLPDMDGMEVLRHITKVQLPVTVVVVTSSGSIKTAVEAMQAGAYDFVVKPAAEERVVTTARNAFERGQLKQTIAEIQQDFGDGNFHGFVGKSPPMLGIFKMIENVARSKATVFITGESGTGKEICAEAIHRAGPRGAKAFIPLNCAAIPKDLIESEIFGHVKGAFTGATADREGAASAADGGTLFLDEICEMDINLQTKLLRFLQTGMVQKVGSDTLQAIDVRVVCATNQDPLKEVEEGRLREDLYYRLYVVPIHIPPLRERGADVLEIAQSFLQSFSLEEGKKFQEFSLDAEDRLFSHSWPGNVRELQNIMRNAIVLHEGEILTADMLSFGNRPKTASLVHETTKVVTSTSSNFMHKGEISTMENGHKMVRLTLGRTFAELEKEIVMATFDYCGGSIPKASKILKMSPSTLYRKREEWSANKPE